MSADPTTESCKALPPRRAEHVSLGGLLLQAAFALVVLVLAGQTASKGLWLSAPQMGLAALFWLVTYLHLRMRRLATEEAIDLEEAERRRQRQGMEALFTEKGEGPAGRNLRHMDRVLAPAISLLLALGLLAPTAYFLFASWTSGLSESLSGLAALDTDNAYGVAVAAVFMALGCFVLGTYAAGLSREKNARLLRAGAGNMLASAVFLFLTAMALAVAKREWVQDWPDKAVGVLVYAWMTVQALEMLVNFVLDLYRPRLAGVQPRPVYDSRLSGLLAEPQGLFQTFAQTMDYQFGFKISETWFFKFLEKALAPLILIQLATLYLLTSFVVVDPGEAAIIERWGALRGLPANVEALPDRDADWDKLDPPLGPGLHLKWPWPIEIARLYNRERISTVSVGYMVEDEAEAREKAEKLAQTVVVWDEEHVKDELKYLMPLPPSVAVAEQKAGAEAPAADAEEPEAEAPDALLLSGEFVIRYRIGTDRTRPGDLYRYAYRYRDAEQTVRAVFEREVTAFLAGADFWEVLARDPVTIHETLLARLTQTVRSEGLGIDIISLNIHNLHPPVGEVGKAFQEVLASRQEKEAKIYEGETEAIKIQELAPSQAHRIRTEAEAYRARRTLVTAGEAQRFNQQMAAWTAAPAAYKMRVNLRMIEEALANVRKVVVPREVVNVIDNKDVLTPDMLEMQEGVIKAGENP